MMARRLGCVLAVLAGAGGLALLLRSLEASFLYFPTREYALLPREVGLDAEDLSIEAKGGAKLAGWWIRGRGNGPRRAILFFHGNGGNISHRLERARLLVDAFPADVALVDYRGYGRSTGRPDEQGLYDDGDAVYAEAARRRFPPDRIVPFGESLGCAVAIETAVRNRCGGVVLEAPFLSIPEMARAIYPFLPSFLVRTRFDNEAKVRGLRVPKLIVAAEKDDVVPPVQTRRLFEAAAPPKEMHVIRGATHNDTYAVGGADYLDVLRRFLESLDAR